MIYDSGGPVEGRQIAYVDLLTETINREEDQQAKTPPG